MLTLTANTEFLCQTLDQAIGFYRFDLSQPLAQLESTIIPFYQRRLRD